MSGSLRLLGRALSDSGLLQIQQAATKAGMDVRSFCDKHYKEFDVGHGQDQYLLLD